MIYNIQDDYIGTSLDLYGEWGRAEIEQIIPYATGTVLDIGANIGTHTLSFAKVAHQVIAIEAQWFNYQSLVANLALNAVENVAPLNVAASSADGTMRIAHLHPDQQINFGAMPVGVGDTFIPSLKIDSLNLRGVSLIKIDVEGHEEEVLKGATDTIKRERPILYIEADRDEKRDSLIACIESLGYSHKWHISPLFNKNNFNDATHNEWPNIYAKNLLCWQMSSAR